MQFTRLRIIIAALLLAAAGAGGFAYFRYKSFTAYLAGQLGGQLGRKLGREVKFARVSFSPLKGIVIRDACVSRRPDFSRGNFFCAERTVIRPRFSALIRQQLYFSGVTFDKPVIKLREKNGRWDFEDLIALLPDTEKGLYLTWNASSVKLRGATLEADMETSGLSLGMEGLDLSLDHFSSYGGHYGLQAQGRLKTVYKGKLVSADIRLENDAVFEYGGLSSARGSFSAEDLSCGAITLKEFGADWKLFNMRRPLAEKNYSASVSAGGLLVPAQEGSMRGAVAGGLKLFSAAMGKPAPEIEDLEVSGFAAAFSLNSGRLAVKDISLRADFLELDAALAIDGPAKTAEAELKAAIGGSKLSMSASGPIKNPKIKPLLSDTLSEKFKQALAGAENALLRIFPVTGDTP